MRNQDLNISIIIAVYQRQDELKELLESLANQIDKNFGVIVVDDGSPGRLQDLAEKFQTRLNVHYFYKENSGPAQSRNFGAERASGNYFIFLDSDTIAPPDYLEVVRKELTKNYVDAFGGPDAAGKSFTDLQKAITFSMTSFLTTGGIRGGKKHVGKFQPRSFNMGISKDAFEKTGGFGNLRIGEDPDLSMTLWENGFETRLFPDAKVYHRRRTSLKKFAKQVYQFGVARPILNQRHPEFTKLAFWFPALFSIGLILSIIGYLASITIHSYIYPVLEIPFLLYLIYLQIIFLISSIQYRSLKVGVLSVITTLAQMISYGFGFLKSWILLNIYRQKPEKAFPGHFSK